LTAIGTIKKLGETSPSLPLQAISAQLNPCTLIIEKIENELSTEPPVMLVKGGVMKEGVNAELDRLRKIAFGGKGYLLANTKAGGRNNGHPIAQSVV